MPSALASKAATSASSPRGFRNSCESANDVVRPDNSRVFPDRAPVICQVRMINETPLVPDLERLEEMIADETRVGN